MFEPTAKDVTEACRNMRKEELHNPYSTEYYLLEKIRTNEMSGACGTYGRAERRGAYGVLVGRPDGKGLLGRPRHR